jgi:ABC-type transport system substrate-binding protein
MKPNMSPSLGLTRRHLLRAGAALAGAAAVGTPVHAQTARAGGTFRVSMGDPPHFDPHLTASWSTQIVLSFTHSRLVKHRAGPAVAPGTFQIEGDVAESWAQTGDRTYIFRLRHGVRWQPKPPLNGRELTAEDVKYLRALSRRDWQSQPSCPRGGGPGRGPRSLHGPLHPQGALRLVP